MPYVGIPVLLSLFPLLEVYFTYMWDIYPHITYSRVLLLCVAYLCDILLFICV